MKKIVALILALTLVFTFTACSAGGGNETTTANTQSTASGTTSAEAEQTEETPRADKKILTIYFSSANTVDAISSATPYFDGVASTEYLAQYINKKVGGDIAKITPVKDYPEDYNGTADAAKVQNDKDERPEFQKLEVNPEDYDVIFVGYPMWWYTLPMIMYTFFDTYDFSGKTVIPFNTHEGSGDGGTYDEIQDFEPNATVLEGFNVRGNSADKADSDLDEWLAGLNY
ncbi:MAG: flavodoxin [Ruminococcaceae bacterium]|nr:flavodoxin [Oscillospiraceae bacterium]